MRPTNSLETTNPKANQSLLAMSLTRHRQSSTIYSKFSFSMSHLLEIQHTAPARWVSGPAGDVAHTMVRSRRASQCEFTPKIFDNHLHDWPRRLASATLYDIQKNWRIWFEPQECTKKHEKREELKPEIRSVFLWPFVPLRGLINLEHIEPIKLYLRNEHWGDRTGWARWDSLLLIAAVAFPDIAWFIFVLTGSILVISLLVSGLSTIINEIRD